MMPKIRRCQHPLLLALGTLPLPVLIGLSSGSAPMSFWLIWPCAYLLLTVLCIFLPGKWRLPVGILTGLGLLAAGICLLNWRQAWFLLFIPAGYAALLMASLPIGGWTSDQELSSSWIFACLGVQIVAQLAIRLQNQVLQSLYRPAHPVLLAGMTVFLLLCLFSFNRENLRIAMPGGSIPASIRNRNRLLIWLMMGLALLISLIPAIGRALRQLWSWTKEAIFALIRFLANLLAFGQRKVGGGGGSGDMDMTPALEAGEPSFWAQLLEKIAAFVVIVLLLAVALWLLRLAWKHVRRLARMLIDRLRRYAVSASEDYVDEMVDTRSQGEERFGFAQNLLRRRKTRRDLRKLPPREQIRTHYGLLKGRHPEWTASQTARDTLPADSASLYERARYSSHDISAEDAQQFLSRG